MTHFQYVRPETLDAALPFLAENGGETTIVAGGTDVMVDMRQGKVRGKYLLDIGRLGELKGIEVNGEGLCIGAGVTIDEISRSDILSACAPTLRKCASTFAGRQVRNVATIGGNVAHCSPCGDTIPPLVIHGAKAVLVSTKGRRQVPVEDIASGPYACSLPADELILKFVLNPEHDLTFSDFIKIGRRKALAIARISLAAMARQDGSGRIDYLRLSLGSCTPTPWRVIEVEDFLTGVKPTEPLLWKAGRILAEKTIEVTGGRASAAYKEPAVQGLLFQNPAAPGAIMTKNFNTIGKSIAQIGVEGKLTGKALFSADIVLDSPLVLKVLRSGRPHAEIVSIDTRKAQAVAGVVRIFTAADIPGRNLTGIINADQPLLAVGKVRSKADAVALVAAETEEAAGEALDKIEVVYRDLPAVFDPEKALADNAPKIHEKGNLLSRRIVRKGNTEAAFKACKSIIERTYSTQLVEHNTLEPDAGAGFVDEDGTLVIYASTQNPHYDHREVAVLLGIDDAKVRIIQAATGGGFGSKLDLNMQGFIGLALHHLGRPVRFVYSREEAYIATSKRHPLKIRVKTGADASGRLLALDADILCDTGAYASYGIAVVSRAAVHITGPYEIENVSVVSRGAYTNNPFAGAMRGFGTPQAAFAHESQMDLHAKDLGLDPLEIRLINALRLGSETATGQVLGASIGMVDCLKAVEPYYRGAVSGWVREETDPYKKRGIGIGAMWYGIGNTGAQNPSTAAVEMDLDGRVSIFSGAADIGQGSTTVLAQIVAETLGLCPEDIGMVVADTKYTPNAGATSASRQTYISGNAVREAALKLGEVLRTEAVNRLRAPRSSLIFDNGHVAVSFSPERRIELAALAKRAHARGEPLTWQGYFDPETVPLDPETAQGAPYATYAFACQLALVTVDMLTGEVSVEKIVAAHDVGRAINPENVAGQICGGVAMGVGFALMEEFIPDSTSSMKDYHIPTCFDMPEVVPLIIESPEPSGPFGAKGVGEPALVATAPAILNGLAYALNERIYSLPANLERVLETITKSGLFGPRGE